MIVGIKDIYYNVSNMKEAVSFYAHILGMSVVYETEYWTSLSIDGLTVGLHWTGGNSIPAIAQDDHGANQGATLTLQSDNIQEDKQLLIDNNVIIVSELDEEFGEIIVFKDLDGNILKLMNPKY